MLETVLPIPFWLEMAAALTGGLATYLDPIVDLLDNLSVALWAVISVGKGIAAGLDIIPSVILEPSPPWAEASCATCA